MSGPEPATSTDAASPAALWPLVVLWARALAKWGTGLYVGSLLILLLWLEWGGEKLWLSGILLFAPPQILLLPLVALTPFCLVVRIRSVLWHFGAIAVLAFVFMTFRWHSPAGRSGAEITAITHNTGQGSRAQFYAFLDAQKPDLIVMQDARGRGNEFARKYPNQHIAGTGEFLLVSRWPIMQSELVRLPSANGRAVAARFEVLRDNRAVIIYSVHLPTPRHQLNRFLSGRALAQLFGDDPGSGRTGSYADWTAERIRLARELGSVFAKESMPFLVFGDFNTPDHGMIYHTFAAHLTDAHLVAGRGWGLTFPGRTRNPLSARGPWLRIDYAFAGRGWQPTWCMPEPGRQSQHCAVVARFVPKS